MGGRTVHTILVIARGHAGVKRNERAVRLAGTAVISYGCALNHADVFHALQKQEECRTHLDMVIYTQWKD
jgi:hypothetical protein